MSLNRWWAATPIQAAVVSPEALTALNDPRVAARGTMSDDDRKGMFGGWIDADGCKVDSGVLAPELHKSPDF